MLMLGHRLAQALLWTPFEGAEKTRQKREGTYLHQN
jgi:hypothetical protein